MNDRLVSVTPSLRRKLKSAFQQQFKSTKDFLLRWSQQAETLGKSPSEADIEKILYSQTQSVCVYWIINGVCQLLLNLPYRDNSLKQVPLVLKQKLCDKFYQQFKVQGEIAWGEFAVAWGKHLNDSDPPRHQTLRNFLTNEERNSCEHWLIDGLCQLLLDCSFDAYMEQGLENYTQPLPIASQYQPNSLPSITPPTGLDTIRWVGRTALVVKLERQLQEDCRILSIVGITGIGKTSLAIRLTLETSVAIRFQEAYTVSMERTLSNFLEVARQLLGERIAQEQQLQKEPDLLVQAVVNKLRSQPCLIILDMVEEILESDGEGSHQFSEVLFTKLFEQIVKSEQMPSRIVLTSQDLPPAIAEGRYPSRLHIERLKGLEEIEALELFEIWDVRIHEEVDLENLKRIICVYEGHPLALRVIAGEIRMPPYNGDIRAYWYDYGSEITAVESMKSAPEEKSRADKPRIDRYSIGLTDLVKKRIDRIFTRLYKAEPLACLMLCQGAVYRRAVERSAWLLTISEHSHEAQASAFQSLQRRFLLEEEYTERKVLYRPHSLIRRVALDRLAQLEGEVLPL